jgi:hypothetical protein
MEKEATLTRLRPDNELTEPQRCWLKHYRASEVSGKSMAEYAREQGLAITAFYYWKKRLIQLGAIAAERLSDPPVFHKITIQREQCVDATCRIRFPNGVECEMTGMDERGLASLLISVSRPPS